MVPRQTFNWLEEDSRPLDWNGPGNRVFTRFEPQDLQRPIAEHFERIVVSYGDRVAIREGEKTLTYRELWDGVSGLAETLEAQTQPGDLIGILLPAGPLFPLAMLASLAAGCPFVALDTHCPLDWLDRALADARPALIITAGDGLAGLEARMPSVRVLRLTDVPAAARDEWRPAAMDVDAPACVLFTSGSTGRPKGIVNSQRNVLQRVAQSINAAHINATDRLLTLAPPCTIVGVRDVMTALLAGASIHLLDPQGVGAREIADAIRAEDATILFAFPALLRSVVAARDERAEASLRLVRVGGDTTLWKDIETLRAWLAPDAAIQVVYAATEAPMMQWFVDARCRRDDARIPIGYPLPGNHLALIDEDGGATAPGNVGELVVASPYVSLGTWAEGRLVNGSVETVDSGGRVFRTGDLARLRSDGLLERVGRKDRQVKIRGSRVDLDGVEAMLREHPLVRDVAAVARTHAADGTVSLVAYVSARDEAPVRLIEELRTWTRSAAPSLRPSRFYPMRSIPRLPSSKLDVRALAAVDDAYAQRERAESIDDTRRTSFDDDPICGAVARVWEAMLLVPVRSSEDDFFDSGGDSLKAMAFVLELERALHLEIALTLINEAPTFGQLCEALRQRRAPASSLLVTLKPGDDRPPVFVIPGIGGNVVKVLAAARRVAYAGAVIGIRARGAVRGETPHTRIDAMAVDYVNEIKQRQPRGPYYLCGYSSGGLVAFEIARRLHEAGDAVGFVGLLDTTLSPVRWPSRSWLSDVGRRLALLATSLRAMPVRSWPIRVAACTLFASARYRPGFYPGQLTLFSPTDRDSAAPSLEATWRSHARTVVVVETEGTHTTMLSPRHAETTAACLARCLLATPNP